MKQEQRTETVELARLQVVHGVAYHAGRRTVPVQAAEVLRARGALVEPTESDAKRIKRKQKTK